MADMATSSSESGPAQSANAARGFVTTAALLREARAKKRAVAALNFYNAETLRGHIEAARELALPLILQTTEQTIDYLGIELVLGLARGAAQAIDTPLALHLDHGKTRGIAERAIEAGYSSVMIDGSALPFEQNVELTRAVVQAAHARGVSVEAELGHVGQAASDDPREFYTQPEDARRFVDATGVDTLAVAVGTAHGFYRGEVVLDFERLEKIRDAVPETPLVLHGGSGVPRELLQRAIECGIAKVNIGTEIKDAFTAAVKASLMASDDIDLRRTFMPGVHAVRELALEKLRSCARI
jgi:tagatose 1,6-diphosphate aldolase GatY/KbaY